MVNMDAPARRKYPLKDVVKDLEEAQRKVRELRFRLLIDYDDFGTGDLDQVDAKLERLKQRAIKHGV